MGLVLFAPLHRRGLCPRGFWTLLYALCGRAGTVVVWIRGACALLSSFVCAFLSPLAPGQAVARTAKIHCLTSGSVKSYFTEPLARVSSALSGPYFNRWRRIMIRRQAVANILSAYSSRCFRQRRRCKARRRCIWRQAVANILSAYSSRCFRQRRRCKARRRCIWRQAVANILSAYSSRGERDEALLAHLAQAVRALQTTGLRAAGEDRDDMAGAGAGGRRGYVQSVQSLGAQGLSMIVQVRDRSHRCGSILHCNGAQGLSVIVHVRGGNEGAS